MPGHTYRRIDWDQPSRFALWRTQHRRVKLGNGHAAEARRAPALESDGPPSVFTGQIPG